MQPSSVIQAGKRLLTRRWTYLGAAVVAVVAATSMALGGVAGASCSESPGQVASRLAELQQTYADVYQQESAEIQACQSMECERPAKLEIAAALRSYNQGLSPVCWPSSDQALVANLVSANAHEANAYSSWADAATPADDQVLQVGAAHAAASERSAWQALRARLG